MQENTYTEYKSSFNDSVIESLVAFANARGGKVLIGINDEGIPVAGFAIGQESMQKWLNETKVKTRPSIIPDAELIEVDGCKVVELSIKEFPIKPVSFKGRYFKRIGNSNHQLSLDEIAELHLRTFNSSWDNYINYEHSLDSISLDKVRTFIGKCNEDKESVIQDDPLIVLTKFELIKGMGVTNACYLLFSKKDIFSSVIELGRFSTPTSIKDGLTLRSDLFTEVEEVLNFVKKHINKGYVISGDPRHEERWQYPLPAIREIVINMIVHRDYMHYGDSSVKIYDDKIEFFNPGSLPEGISVEQLLGGNYVSQARNKKIVSAFKEAQLVEKYGSGIKRICESFLNYGLDIPVFENLQHGFVVTVYAESRKTVEKTVEKILEAIRNNGKITMKELQEVTGVGRRGIEWQLKKLKEEDVIRRIGPDRGGYWEII